MKMTGAEAVIKCLLEENVNLVYGYPGGAIMPIYDAHYKYKNELKHVLTRHEQGAVHSAQGYARVTGDVGVVFATSGPGATNLITGIADAQIDSTPLVCITGQVHSHLLGTDAFQETDVVGLSMPVTKWNFQVTDANEIPEALAKAFYIARTGRPGPVLIDITKDAQFQEFDFEYKPFEGMRSYQEVPKVDQNELRKAANLLNQSKKPYILWGQGVVLSGAEKEFESLLNVSGIPAASTILGLSALDSNHELNVGMLGMHGNYAPNVLTNECDVLFAVGMRFDDRVTGNLQKYAKQAKVIHLEIDDAEIGKNVPVDVALRGDVKDVLEQLIPLLEQQDHGEWLQAFKDLENQEREAVINEELNPSHEGMTMGEVIARINEITKGDHIVVTDVGQHQMVACRYAQFQKTRSMVTSGGLGTMGFALPAAIGAKMGKPERTVIAVIGDGGFQMTLQELGTIMQEDLNVKILILNNEYLGMVRQWQELFFDKRYAETPISSPDFVQLAGAYNIEANRVSERKDLVPALKAFLESDKSHLLEVMVVKENNVFPMMPTGAAVNEMRLS